MYEYNIIFRILMSDLTEKLNYLLIYFGKQVDGLIFMSDAISDEVRNEMSRGTCSSCIGRNIR